MDHRLPRVGGNVKSIDTKLASTFAEKKNSEKSSKMVVWRYLKRERK